MSPVPIRFFTLLALNAAFSWWSWRAVARRSAAADAGAGAPPPRGMFGVTMLVYLSLQQSLTRVDAALGAAVRMPAFWHAIPLQLFICFPFCVWADYFFFRLVRARLWGAGPSTPPQR
jgi:hypothetical protein